MRTVATTLVVVAAFGVSHCDLYINNPRGSNNKLHEVSNNVKNNNRLFDSQNNGAGGYQVGDNCQPVCSENNKYDVSRTGAGKGVMHYFEGSVLYIEWSLQHSSGVQELNPKSKADVVIQYMCGDWIRDGNTTDRVPLEQKEGKPNTEYGMHEPRDFYEQCRKRERNKGLFTADKNLNNGRGATSTRQNPGGNNESNRHGFECPEERDYYPYWHPTPWRDIAVLTSDPDRCSYYRKHSENVEGRSSCSNAQHNRQKSCSSDVEAQWHSSPAHGLDEPECLPIEFMRDNHHGNSGTGQPLSYNWTLPYLEDLDATTDQRCVLRIRYNISTGEYDGWADSDAKAIDSRYNQARSPVKTNPLDDFVGAGYNLSGPLRLAFNTAQMGRTFEDRSHMFVIKARPQSVSKSKKIYNLNVRGRRGNIVQVYPSVEYDFAPNSLAVDVGDVIHFQWTGSDANNPGNAGEGRRMTDRSNLVVLPSLDSNTPLRYTEQELLTDEDGDPDAALAARYAFLGQQQCAVYPNDNNNDRQKKDNCALLNNAPAYFDGGLVQMRRSGTFYIASTRNNNFSNRSQKGTITVRSKIIVLILGVLGGTLGTIGAAVAVTTLLSHQAAANPSGKLAKMLEASPILQRLVPSALSSFDKMADQHTSLVGRIWFKKSVNWRATVVLGLVCCGWFLLGFFRHSSGLSFDDGVAFSFAKGGGYLLDFLLTAVLFPVMKNLVSYLRTTPICELCPLDDHKAIHTLLAKLIALAGLVHVLGHWMVHIASKKKHWAAAVFWSWHGITGHLLVIIFVVMYVTAGARHGIRVWKFKFGNYDLFWRSHHLYLCVYALLIIHAEPFYRWIVWPLLLFGLDKTIHYMRGNRKVELCCVSQEASGTDVMSLEMRIHTDAQTDFTFRAGQYLLLNCPEISKYEWHPFTITSAPEEETVSVHIRTRGDWTRTLQTLLNPSQLPQVKFKAPVPGDSFVNRPTLRTIAPEMPEDFRTYDTGIGAKLKRSLTPDRFMRSSPSKQREPPDLPGSNFEDCSVNTEELEIAIVRGASAKMPQTGAVQNSDTPVALPVVLRVDGPYGSGSDRTHEYNTVMLVGTGIGVTPFVSVMKSLKIRQASSNALLKPSKVYFYWVCRDKKEFSWFSWLINSLQGLGDRFELNTYMTGELDLEQLIADRARHHHAAAVAPDTTAPTDNHERTATWPGNKWAGRPDWRRIFKEKAEVHANQRVGVFLCGPGAQELEAACKASSKGSTKFLFHKEVF
jgi:predicted ferric reductase/plastocyanin